MLLREGNKRVTGLKTLRAIMTVAAILYAGAAMAQPQQPSYEIVSRDNGALEIRFHGVPMRAVHADDAQNALSLDFLQPVDGGLFDRLAGDMPDWIAMSYANYDTGVIRATRPVTFLTRQEGDGFSLRMVPRGPAPPPPGPVALRGYTDAPPQPMMGPPPPPPPSGFNRDSFGAARNYYGLELAVRRTDDPVFTAAYDRANAEAASSLSLGSEWRSFDGGDTIITSAARARVEMGGGATVLANLYDADVKGDAVRLPGGTFAAYDKNILSGSGGIAAELWGGQELHALVLGGNGIVGGQLGILADSADGFWNLDVIVHRPDLSTPQAVAAHAQRDEAEAGIQRHLGYGLWGGLAGHGRRYGIDGDDNVAVSAGWNANLRWSANLGGVLAGIAYDGMGDYRVNEHTRTGAAPSPYVPLSVRDMEVHSGTVSLSNNFWDALWLDLYGGYSIDRFANEGGIYGGALHYRPTPGVDLALGVRHTEVSLLQGETAPETSAGLTLSLGFGGAPRAHFLSY